MKAYFAFSQKEITQHEVAYRSILKALKADGHQVAGSNIRLAKKIKSKSYSEITLSIQKSDFCIFDLSQEDVAIGQQVMYAIDHKKPTLVLADLRIAPKLETSFIGGSKSDFLSLGNYKSAIQLEKILARFLRNIEKPRKTRMTFYLEKPLYDSLVNRAKESGRTKSEMVEYLILQKKAQLEAQGVVFDE